jgi:hypothetical protein
VSENRPVRDLDPQRNAAYWERISRIVDQAPPLTDDQRARIRTAFHAPKGVAHDHRQQALRD